MTMRWLFSFTGRIWRLPYALWSLGLFLAQHVITLGIFKISNEPLDLTWRFYVIPLRSLAELKHNPEMMALVAISLMLIISWSLCALAFRRASDANVSAWIAVLTVAPLTQIPAILGLCLLPSAQKENTSELPPIGKLDWSSAAKGVLAATALTSGAVAVGALIFGTYGYGMFVVAPLIIGAITAYLANSKHDIGLKQTNELVVGAMFLACVALVLFALEGIVCIVLATPLAIGFAVIGALFGRNAAIRRTRSGKQTLLGIALLPAVFASEHALPATEAFSTEQSIDINASSQAVWASLIDMKINVPPGLPFRLGVAYPIRGEISGQGVGAIRRGVFSTGVAVERVTEWTADRKLAFVVLSDPPAMHEMSPYAHVHAPHVRGYFTTGETSFELVPLARGRTRVVERTSHELKLDPIAYWLPFARWVVNQNNERVLQSLKLQSEQL